LQAVGRGSIPRGSMAAGRFNLSCRASPFWAAFIPSDCAVQWPYAPDRPRHRAGGQLVLSGLPFPDGQPVRIVVVEVDGPQREVRTVAEVRRLLRGGVERFDDPFEPVIPTDQWEMLR
jgi:hypothetical protein